MKQLLWIDLEMSGLDEQADRILEVAAVVTDFSFETKGSLHRVVQQPKEVLETMNDWCKKHHAASGLTALVPNGTPLERVEDELIALCDKHFKADERIIISGNSIGNDRRFIDKYWPRFAKRLHYRMVDVSSFKEVFRERYKVMFDKRNGHRAMDDINESIRELKHYLAFVSLPSVVEVKPS
jgi:oligoribonuclease